MAEQTYRVVWPLAKSASRKVAMRPRISDLAGKTVCHLSHGGFRDQEIRPIVEERLERRYPGIKFVDHAKFGNIHGPRGGEEVLAALPGRLAEFECDAVITGIGS